MNSTGTTSIGDTGRDVVYRVDFAAGQELDLHMEGQGDWDEALYLIGDCDYPIGTCLAASWAEGTGVRLKYTAPKAHSAWLICDSWGVGDRQFFLSGSNGMPVPDLMTKQSSDIPSRLYCSPNPFNPRTRISFELAQDEHTRIEVFAVDGRKVKTLTNETLTAGHHIFYWNGTDSQGRNMTAGAYFCRLSTPSQSERIKMILLK